MVRGGVVHLRKSGRSLDGVHVVRRPWDGRGVDVLGTRIAVAVGSGGCTCKGKLPVVGCSPLGG